MMRENSATRRKILAVALVIAAIAIAAFSVLRFSGLGRAVAIPYSEALKFTGQEKTVEGVVEVVWALESGTVLDFDLSSTTNLVVYIPSGSYSAFPTGFSKFYQDKKITVTGKIIPYQSWQQITVTHPSQIAVIGEAVFDAVPSEKNLISWKDAANFAGQDKTVEGIVTSVVRPDDKVTWLEFEPESKTSLQAKIFAVTYDKFPEGFDSLYKGKKVWVAGKIGLYKGQPELIVKRPSQIRIVP